jgi:hypothetical protein
MTPMGELLDLGCDGLANARRAQYSQGEEAQSHQRQDPELNRCHCYMLALLVRLVTFHSLMCKTGELPLSRKMPAASNCMSFVWNKVQYAAISRPFIAQPNATGMVLSLKR